ncbi:type II toxin-antitoxin system RelE family toxin [Levilactobacillus mulengensis]|uniref:type II toxin-antitoxin system RelE family toxin n=1 Tax=Levilactobacillus mulengensis TaxID=2486025 RepID=UPI000F78FF68|nr:addiction module toxin RelE [Levilactobacillus mulengensis]
MSDTTEAYAIAYLEEARNDYQKLDGSQKVFVDKGLNRIRKLGMQAGQPLAGSLINCRKLKNKRMGLRIVFRQVDQEIQIIQILAIGKRADKAVYRDAAQRLSQFKDEAR